MAHDSTPANSSAHQPKERISRGAWLALTAALLGWMFDGFEMGIFSMVGRPALFDLVDGATEQSVNRWFGVVVATFLVGAATGGVLFGWLGDRIGRVRAMTLSVLTYALFTGLGGLALDPYQLAALRFIASLGMGGEWALGVALVMEAFPNRSRAFMAGLIGAAANVGYLLVGIVGLALLRAMSNLESTLATAGFSESTIEWLLRNEGWRIMMMVGAVPAVLTLFIRLFVPESEKWVEENKSGSTSHWATRDLIGVLVGAAGPGVLIYVWGVAEGLTLQTQLAVTVPCVLVAVGGYTFPALRFLQRQAVAVQRGPGYKRGIMGRMMLGAALGGVALLGTWGSAQWAPAWAAKIGEVGSQSKEQTQIWLAIGAIIGTMAAALIGDWLGRRVTYALFCVLSFASLLLFYQGNTQVTLFFLVSALVMGICTSSFYGWLPLYLPELFPTSMRATGQGFAFNFGRIIAAIGALQTGNLFSDQISFRFLGQDITGGYPFACSVMASIYVVGFLLIWFAPETKGKPLPD